MFCIFIQFAKTILTGMAGAGWVSRKRWHRAVLCPSSALKPPLVMESRHSRNCPLCFSTSFFCSKLLTILKMNFISIFHACATGDKVLDRLTSQVPKAIPCFDWESLYHDFQGITYFYFLYLQHSRWVLERRSMTLSKKGCVWDFQAILSVFLLPSHVWKPRIQEKEPCDTDIKCHNRLCFTVNCETMRQ